MTDWRQVKLGEICRLLNGRAYKQPELLDIGPTPVLRVGNFFTNRSWYYSDLELEADKYCESGDLLYAWSASFGPRIWEGGKAIYHYHIWKIEPDFKQVEKRFLFHFLEWDKELIRSEQGAGTTMIHVTKGSMENRLLRIPSLPEQRRIVAVLDEAFEGLAIATANTEKNLKNARELFESYLCHAFSIDTDEWKAALLEEVAHSDCTLSYGIVQPGDEFEDGLPIVRPTDLTSKVIALDGLKFINPSLATGYQRTTLQGGELLLCVRGSTGVLSIASSELAGGNVTRGIVPIRFRQDLLSQDFGYYLLSAPNSQKQIREKTYGAALMQINIRDIRKIEVRLPSLEIQRRIVKTLDELSLGIERLEILYRQKLAAIAELKQSLLQKAFAGELTKDFRPELETALT